MQRVLQTLLKILWKLLADFRVLCKDQEKGDQEKEKELIHQDEMSSRVWVCTSTHSSTKVMVLDASQPSDLLDSFYACNTHVVCIASVPGRLIVCLWALG